MLLSTVLLALSPLVAPDVPVAPSRFFNMEVVSLGAVYDASSPNFTTPRMFSFRILRFGWTLSRVRFGLAPAEVGAFMAANTEPTGMGGFLPVYAGFDLYRNPRKTLLCYSMVPDVYVEGTWFPILQARGSVSLRFNVNAEVEYFGLGLGLEAGYLTAQHQDESRIHVFGAGFRLRALVASFGLH